MKARRAGTETDAVRARHPEAPWMWRADWAAGRIEDNNRATMAGAWIFAAFWNLISLPAAFFGVRQALREESYGVLFVLIFPAVGLGLLVWAIRATIRFRRFGVSRFELATVPAPVGRSLRGTVLATGVLNSPEGLRVTLACVRRVTTGAGKNRSTSERVLWQEEQRVAGRQIRSAQGMVISIPVAFDLPADGEPCDTTHPRNQVVWRLAVSAEVPGVDYASTWLAAVWATVHFGAPMVLQVTFGAFGLFLIWATAAAWLGVSQVTVGDGTVTVASGLLAPMRERRFAAAELADVTIRVGMQAGNTPYYDLMLVRKDGKQTLAGRGLRDKREAEWLAATLREALG